MRFTTVLFSVAFLVAVSQVGRAELIINTLTTEPRQSAGQVNSGESFFDGFTITGPTAFIPNSIQVDLIGGLVYGIGPAAVPIAEIYLNDGMYGGPGTILAMSTITSPNAPPSISYETYTFSGFAPLVLVPGTYYLGLHNLGGPGTALFVQLASDPLVNTGTSGYVVESQAALWSLDATPVPEPSSLLLAAAGGAGLLVVIVRRTRASHRGRALAIAAIVCGLPSTLLAASYTITDLGTLGGSYSYGYGINAGGQVTGYSHNGFSQFAFLYDGTMHNLGTIGGSVSRGYAISDTGKVTGMSYTPSNADHAFLYDGTMHDLGTFGGSNSYGYGINASGQVTGTAQTTGDAGYHAFLYDGTMHDLGTFGGTYSYGYGINASGMVTGQALTTGDVAWRAFLYDGTMHDLGSLGGSSSYGYGINAGGQVTGKASTPANITHAFLYDGTMHDLGTLGGSSSTGYGINSSGQITGSARYDAGNDTHAFIYDALNGTVDLNSLIAPLSGWVLTEGRSINDAGQIAGFGTIGGHDHAFLLTPVPEPSSCTLAAIAGVLWVFHASGRAGRRSRSLSP